MGEVHDLMLTVSLKDRYVVSEVSVVGGLYEFRSLVKVPPKGSVLRFAYGLSKIGAN